MHNNGTTPTPGNISMFLKPSSFNVDCHAEQGPNTQTKENGFGAVDKARDCGGLKGTLTPTNKATIQQSAQSLAHSKTSVVCSEATATGSTTKHASCSCIRVNKGKGFRPPQVAD